MGAQAPFGDHHVRQQDKVERQCRAVRRARGEALYVMGVSCHVGDTSGFVEVSCSWQLWLVMITTRRLTETVREAQRSRASIEVLVVSVQSPGPRNGTSATLKAELSEPLSTPLETAPPGTGTLGLALEPVTSTYFVLLTAGVGLVFCGVFWGGVG